MSEELSPETLAEMKLPPFVARLDERTAFCRSCRATVIWCVTKRGMKMPLNLDGTSHFSTCPHAELHRNKR